MTDESESPTVMKDLMRLMVALFGEERSYATYKEMAEAAETLRKDLEREKAHYKDLSRHHNEKCTCLNIY